MWVCVRSCHRGLMCLCERSVRASQNSSWTVRDRVHISALIVITTVDGVIVVSFLLAPAHLVIKANPFAPNAIPVVVSKPVWRIQAVAADAFDIQRPPWDLPSSLAPFFLLGTAVWGPCPRL